MAKDYYTVLGVGRGATDKELKQAYRRLARRHHPDLNPGNKEAEARFKEINEAYEVLSDPEKRQKYNQFGENWRYAEQFAGGQQGDFDFGAPEASPYGDIFERFFEARSRPRRGRDIDFPLEITVEEAFAGTTRLIKTSTGQIEVKVPPGVSDGSRVRIAGKGRPGPGGGPPGDLYLVTSVKPHPTFERKGYDLYVDVPVPLTVAVLGGEAEVPTLKGRVSLKIKPETQNGQVFRLAKQGMVHLGNNGSGDLYARVRVVLPTKISPRERELFQELHKLRRDNG